MIATLAFYVFAAVLLGSAALVVSARNPVHSVLFLILAFFNAAGLFLLAGAEFLAMILVIVYVGAVAVLFLFVVMMLDIDFTRLREGVQRYAPVGATVGVILLVELASVLGGWQLLPQSASLRGAVAPSTGSNTAALGDLLYTHNVLLFQISGLVLLVAMIGAIVLTLRERKTSRHQNIARQVSQRVEDTLVLVKVGLGAAVTEAEFLRPLPEPAVAPAEPHGGGHGHGGTHAAEVR